MDHRITVFIPNYNGARFLPGLFESLIAQTMSDFNCVFLDDGSTDESITIAEKYSEQLRHFKIHQFVNAGPSKNWNRGIGMADTEYFCFLHCDDLYKKPYLEQMIILLDDFPAAGMAHCAAKSIDVNSQHAPSALEDYKRRHFLPSARFLMDGAEEFERLLEGNYICCPSVVFRTSAVHQVGTFNTDLRQAMDWEYWFRMVLEGFSICGTNRVLFQYRRHTGSFTARNSEDLSRYREELLVLNWAYKTGVARGLVRAPYSDKVLRDIVAFNIALQLQEAEKYQARATYEFLITNFQTGFVFRTSIKIMMFFGRLGGIMAVRFINVYSRFI